jgi:hypothetical protein
MARKAQSGKPSNTGPRGLKRNVVPDKVDLRDRRYMPAVARPPAERMLPDAKVPLPILDQKNTNACTGFALATLVTYLRRRHLGVKEPAASAFMIYSMARRYDEFPGAIEEDTGSSLRGAMKGWYKHGVCRADLWQTEPMPDPAPDPANDWWYDAVYRPLGAYYRVDVRSVTDMHVALMETGVLYASAVCHDGWMTGFPGRKGTLPYWLIPPRAAKPSDGGHAFAIVGYTPEGFIVQNSWGKGWGTGGLALLSYQDWTEHAMDCWVAQIGVVTRQHEEIAHATTLREKGRQVVIAASKELRNREIAPFIVDMENNGKLSKSGDFRTQIADVKWLADTQIPDMRNRWGLKENQPIDIAIYAHGGLTGEDTAAATAAQWIPALFEARVFPIFLMWETDLWSTLKNRFSDTLASIVRPTGIPTVEEALEAAKKFWNARLERLLAPIGTEIWKETKQNAKAITEGDPKAKDEDLSGGLLLFRSVSQAAWFKPERVRLHLVGHSAGSIVHSHAVERMARNGWTFESVNFLAAAVTVENFNRTVAPHLTSGAVKRFRTFHLTDAAEQQDPTCRPILGYSRSLLYLVSESFEGGRGVPILGMEKYFDANVKGLAPRRVKAYSAPGADTASTTHGGFDDDAVTRASVIRHIKGGD